MERIVGEVVKRFGRLDCAVANAGQSVDALLLRLKPETLDRLLDVNLKSAFYLCAAVAKPMMKQRAGSIVLVTQHRRNDGQRRARRRTRPRKPDSSACANRWRRSWVRGI